MNNYQISQELNNLVSEYEIEEVEAKLEIAMNRISDSAKDKEDFLKKVNNSKAAKNIINLVGSKYGGMIISDNANFYRF